MVHHAPFLFCSTKFENKLLFCLWCGCSAPRIQNAIGIIISAHHSRNISNLTSISCLNRAGYDAELESAPENDYDNEKLQDYLDKMMMPATMTSASAHLSKTAAHPIVARTLAITSISTLLFIHVFHKFFDYC